MEFKGNLERLTKENTYYRKVIHTNAKQQLVLMCLLPGEKIGMERHPHTSQFIRIEKGKGVAIVNEHRYRLSDGDALVIPPNVYHNIINTSKTLPLQLYTLYSPPEHPKHLRQQHK